jgi:hypothetical protein
MEKFKALMTDSILFMSFGQSNADCHNAGPAFDHPVLDDPRIVLPNDGYGFRGVMGRPRKKVIDGFVPAFGFDPTCQSSGVAAATRFLHEVNDDTISQVIVRSGAKGGRPLVGRVHRDRIIEGIFREHDGTAAILLLSMIEDIYQIAAAAIDMGKPIRKIFIPFFHGEADRNTPRDTYIELMMQLMDIIDDAASDIGIPTTWLLTQAAGTAPTHDGNAWENRLGIKDLAELRPNAAFASTNYALPLFDSAHLSAAGKVLAGEQVGRCAARLENGDNAGSVVKPEIALADGREIHLRFGTPIDTILDRSTIPTPLFTDGFCVAGQALDFVTEVIPTTDGHLRLICADTIPENCRLTYAFATRAKNDPSEDVQYPYGRGCLRRTESVPSLILPEQELHEWIPSFSIDITHPDTLQAVA